MYRVVLAGVTICKLDLLGEHIFLSTSSPQQFQKKNTRFAKRKTKQKKKPKENEINIKKRRTAHMQIQ
jgi:hypothetical protein